MLQLKKSIENKSGYKIFKSTLNDVENIKKYIQKSFFQTLKKNKIISNNLDNYHKLKINDFNHKKIWTRPNRVASGALIKYLKYKSYIFKILKKEFKNLKFSYKVNSKKPDVYWRLVRPFKKNDVGPIHADEWFWDANKWKKDNKNKKILKVWMLLSNKLKKGLCIVPNSHKKEDWIYKKTYKDGLFKPIFNKKKNKFKIRHLITPKGTILIFNYRLLHGGLVNKSNETRVSLEFTLYYEDK